MIDNNKYNITIGDNSTANLIVNSSNSTIQNKQRSHEELNKIIQTLQNDANIDNATRDNAISTFTLLGTEIEAGVPTQDTWNKALTIGASIASVGSLVLALVQQFVK